MGSIRVWDMRGAFLVAIAAWLAAVPAARALDPPPNLVLVILDDVGVELLGAYNLAGAEVEGPGIPPEHRVTPNIDALAARGLLFRNAWSAPLCGATRFSILTGTYGFRSGAIARPDQAITRPPTLPERLVETAPVPYTERAAIGKWHLSPYTPYEDVTSSPTTLGFTEYAGTPGKGPYVGYPWATDPPPPDPVLTYPPEYRTTKEVAEAIRFVEQPHAGPWLLWLALQAAHSPWDESATPSRPASPCQEIAEPLRRVRCLQLQIADEELGELFFALEQEDSGLARTSVILLGDNGSPRHEGARPEPIPGEVNRGGKREVWEGGLNVPLVVAGAGVAANPPATVEETAALVHVVDVFPTLLELAGVSSPNLGVDGRSFARVLAGGRAPRSCVYADGVDSYGYLPLRWPLHHEVAVRDARYKLIRRARFVGTNALELYDLWNDPREELPLPESGPAFEALLAELQRIDANANLSPCEPRSKTGCGLGPELVPVLLVLVALRRRRRGAALDSPGGGEIGKL